MMRIRPGRPIRSAPRHEASRPRIHKTFVVLAILGAIYGWIAPLVATSVSPSTATTTTSQAR